MRNIQVCGVQAPNEEVVEPKVMKNLLKRQLIKAFKHQTIQLILEIYAVVFLPFIIFGL